MAEKSTGIISTRAAKIANALNKQGTKEVRRGKAPFKTEEIIKSGKVEVPGISEFNLAEASVNTPEFPLSDYEVDDPLNPPDSLPGVTKATHSQASTKYEMANYAVDLHRQKYKLDNNIYGAIGDRAKAFDTAISTQRTIEQSKGNYIGLQSDIEGTKQSAIAYDLNRAKTYKDIASNAISKGQLALELQIQVNQLEDSQTKLDELDGELELFQKRLGEYQ